MNNSFIDLHVHSNCSDGKKSIAEILNICVQNEVGVISFAEHYNMGSYKKARRLGTELNIEVIPSIEIGASLSEFSLSNNHICHIVAYYPEYKICKLLDSYELSRDKCVRRTLEKLNKTIPISYTQVKKYARNKNSIGRFDVAIALSKLGYASDPILAYGEYLDYGKTAYITREKETVTELIQQILSAGGVPVLVHPKSLKLNYTDEHDMLHILKDAGLCGIETYNVHNTLEQVQRYLEFANELELISTVGTDFHGINDKDVQIGFGINNNLMIDDYSIVEALKNVKSALYIKSSKKCI